MQAFVLSYSYTTLLAMGITMRDNTMMYSKLLVDFTRNHTHTSKLTFQFINSAK